jgi:hypothetical protein
MTNAEKAAYYAENPTMSAITQLGQKGFGYTGLGMAQNYFNPGFVSDQGMIARGVDPSAYSGRNAMAELNSLDSIAGTTPGWGGGLEGTLGDQPGDYDGQGVGTTTSTDSGGEAASASGGDNASDASPDGFAKGGRVDRNRLRGPDPRGPDQGYAPLQSGEYVIKRDAVRKYGEGMLGKINSGKYAPRG